jgi:hypothetical protein
MVAVAIVAVGFWVKDMMRLREYYLSMAGSAGGAISTYDTLRDVIKDNPAGDTPEGVSKAIDDFDKQYAPAIAHWKFIRDKYLKAARYPWLYVDPDPPEPR